MRTIVLIPILASVFMEGVITDRILTKISNPRPFLAVGEPKTLCMVDQVSGQENGPCGHLVFMGDEEIEFNTECWDNTQGVLDSFYAINSVLCKYHKISEDQP